MSGLTAAALFGVVVLKLSDFVKFVQNKDWNSATTQLGVFVVGFVAVVITSHSDFASGVGLAGVTLSKANWGSQVLIGLVAGGSAGALYDVKRAIDSSTSSNTSSEA